MLAYLSGIDNDNMEDFAILGLAEICAPMVRGGMRAQNARPRVTNPLTVPVTPPPPPPPPSGGGGTQLQQGQPAGKPNRTQILDSAPPAMVRQDITTQAVVDKSTRDAKFKEAQEEGRVKILDKEATSDIDSGKNESGSSDKILGMDKNTAIGVGVGLLVVGFLMFKK
jgi:hypothetical protein